MAVLQGPKEYPFERARKRVESSVRCGEWLVQALVYAMVNAFKQPSCAQSRLPNSIVN
jgi:hypothetical protein